MNKTPNVLSHGYWETVIGLEVHVELSTRSKIFCGCSTAFGGSPNTHCCPVCMGLPGSLPVLNERVLEYAVRAALALHCTIARRTRFDRKNYFYPDLPKAYQISQLYHPIGRGGYVDILPNSRRIRIHEMHMEEDAGKLIHSGHETYPDYNRCGIPLLEIVSEPDFRSAEEVMAYLETLRSMFTYLGISDCRMEEGSMRADVNLSIRRRGDDALGTRTEMKNINSIHAIDRAIESESARQIRLLEHGEAVRQETRHWNDERHFSTAMRSKENAPDYRYFPEPDLPEFLVSEAMIAELRAAQPEFAEQRAARFVHDFGLSEYDAKLLTEHRKTAELFEELLRLNISPKTAANWINVPLARALHEAKHTPEDANIPSDQLAWLIQEVEGGRLNRHDGISALERLSTAEIQDVKAYIDEHHLAIVEDRGALRETVSRIIAANEKAVAEYRGGREKALDFLIGQCMRELRGKSTPAAVREEMLRAL